MKLTKKYLWSWLVTVVILPFQVLAAPSPYQVKSPDGQISLNIQMVDGEFQYSVHAWGKKMINPSVISFLKDAQLKEIKTHRISQDQHWAPVWGQFSQIRDQYQQLTISFEAPPAKGKLMARVYNEGVAFRFVLEEGQKPAASELIFTATLPEGNRYYAPNREDEPLGPVTYNELDQSLHNLTTNGKNRNLQVPLVVQTKESIYLALLESDLYASEGMAAMRLDTYGPTNTIISRNQASLSHQTFTSPWRVILLGKKPGDLVVNTVTQNLATPNQLENSDWVRPGKTLWDWRVHGYKAPDGFTYGINTESYLRFIDFASDNGIEYFLIDDAWYNKVTAGHFEHSERLDLQRVITYAQKKKVELILYYDNRQGVYGDSALFPYYHSLGMKGIKYGFMGNNVPFTKKAVIQSAENKLLIDFHDSPVPYTGISRTFPNAITREYCHGQQDSRRAFTPESFIKMALINAITGPLDMNNGNFDLIGINKGIREKGPKQVGSYYSTVASEAARTLIIFSGLVCIPDAPEAYAAKKDLFEFIQKQPVGRWDETKILNADLDSHITTARRHGKEWFIGSAINQKGGKLKIPMDFLEPGTNYEVTYYEDSPETHCKTNPEAYQIRRGSLRRGEVVEAVLAPGGGHCMWIRPKN
ncbi:glycoside hydrolase family 97 protein [Dyadobacter tibetensis]|uniref:glycoside hydrolase family 97 protein n=1 Tax=Dyadobacter tibetensis TaxID=1211851 RepID=UPI000470CBC8|nr:glycoside hydrolase family 97 protein [Dyadobacter tibetensis]